MTNPPAPVRHRLAGYAEHQPPDDLASLLNAVWRYRGGAAATPPAHRVLPTPGVSVCFEFGLDSDGRLADADLSLIGPVRTPRPFQPRAGWVMEAVQVRPEWARDVLGVAPEEHHDVVVSATEALPASRDLFERALRAVVQDGSALEILLTWARERWMERQASSSALLAHAALPLLTAGVEVGVAADELDVSARHLRRAVRSTAGTPPKYLQRVARLGKVVEISDRMDTRPGWSSLAAGHGFYDQAHMIREFRDLIGCTPAELHRERRTEHVRFVQSNEALSS